MYRLPAVGRADVQDSTDVISAVSEPAHLVAHQRTQHSIVVRPTAVRAISTDIIRQTIVQHCRTSDLELTATCCVKQRLSLSLSLPSYPDLKLICFLLLSANSSTYLFHHIGCRLPAGDTGDNDNNNTDALFCPSKPWAL